MGGLRRTAALLVCLVMLVSLSACNTAIPVATPSITPSLSPTFSTMPTVFDITSVPTAIPLPTVEEEATSLEPEETGEPEPVSEYDILNVKNIGLTEAQFDKINVLLYGAVGMFYFFDSVKTLETADYLQFFDRAVEGGSDVLGFGDKSVYSIQDIEKIVNSGLHANYHARNGDKCDDTVQIRDGVIATEVNGGDPRDNAYIFGISRVSANRILIKFNIIMDSSSFSQYRRKGLALIQEDKDSLFGYCLVSLTEINEMPSFSNATASSWLPDIKSASFMPQNSIDGKLNTGWATDKGKGEWMMLSSEKMQTVTGFSIHAGGSPFAKEGDYNEGAVVRLEFSDGMTYEVGINPGYGIDDYNSFPFSKEIKTKYIKVTIVSSEDKVVYIAEVEVF